MKFNRVASSASRPQKSDPRFPYPSNSLPSHLSVMAMAAESLSPISLAFKWALLGVLLHLATFRQRLDNHGWRLLGLHSIFMVLIFFGASRSRDMLPAAVYTLFTSASFLSGLFTSVVLYRLYFSPIRRFPGPRQAAVTSFYRARLATKSGIRLCTEVKAMHEKYGDYVRTGPREVSILNPNAIPILYGAKSRCRKGPWYDHDMMPREEDKSVFLLRDPAIHSWRRRILDRGFSTRGKRLILWPPQ